MSKDMFFHGDDPEEEDVSNREGQGSESSNPYIPKSDNPNSSIPKTIEFEYPLLEVIVSDTVLSQAFVEEITKITGNANGNLDIDKLKQIISEAEKRDITNARRKVAHTIENQVQSAQEVLREVAVQNTVDAYADFAALLSKRDEAVKYPLKIELEVAQKAPQVCDVAVRDYAIGMNLYDVLYKLLAIGDTQKKEKKVYVGGHGRGFKPSIFFCDRVIIDSFGRKTIVKKVRNDSIIVSRNDSTAISKDEPNLVSKSANGEYRYYITIGEQSDIKEGTRITLENLVLRETPLSAVKKYAVNLTEMFDFKVNGIRVNKGIDAAKVGKLEFKQAYDLTDLGGVGKTSNVGKTGTSGSGKNLGATSTEERLMSIEEKITACANSVEGEAVQQGPMTMLTKPAEIGFVRRVLKIPTGYLFSRSRNQLPKEIDDVVNDKKQTPYKKFYDFLIDNFHKIGSHEFRFLDSFGEKYDKWDEMIHKAYKIARNSLIIFSAITATTAFFGEAVPLAGKYLDNHVILPAIKFIHEHEGISLIGYRLDERGKETGRLTSNVSADLENDNTEYNTNEINLPREFVPEVNKKLFVTRVHCKGTKCEERTEQEAKPDERFIIGRYSPSDRDIFFKFFSYNTLNSDGSWHNGGVKTCVNLLAYRAPNKGNIRIALNLNVAVKTILPAPIGYFTGSQTVYSKENALVYKPKDASVGLNSCLTEPGDYDTTYIQAFSDRTGKVEFGVTPFYMLDSRLEKIMGEKWKKRRESTSWSEVRHFFEVPFKIKYPKAVEKGLKKIDQDVNKGRVKTYDELAQRVTHVLENYFVYNTSPENARRFYGVDNFVNGALDLQGVDCDTANAPLCAVLRARYDIPTRLDIGIQGRDGVLDKRNFHSVCEAYIPNRGWTEYDATPSKISSEAKITIKNGKVVSDGSSAQEYQQRRKNNINVIYNDAGAEKRRRKELAERQGNETDRRGEESNGRIERERGDESKGRETNVDNGTNDTTKENITKETDTDNKETDVDIGRTIAYSLLGVGGIGLIMYGVHWYRRRREKKKLWEEPIVDVYIKEDGNVKEGKISLNKGIEYIVEEKLHYYQKVVDVGIAELMQGYAAQRNTSKHISDEQSQNPEAKEYSKDSQKENPEEKGQKESPKDYPDGFYVLDYGFYTTILDALIKKGKLIEPPKKAEDDDEIDNEEAEGYIKKTGSEQVNDEVAEGEIAGSKDVKNGVAKNEIGTQAQKKQRRRRPRFSGLSLDLSGDGEISGILADISLSEKALGTKQPNEVIGRYHEQIETILDIVGGICKANNYSAISVSGEYEFNNKRKTLAIERSQGSLRQFASRRFTRPTIYVNLNSQKLQQPAAQLRTDGQFIDNLIYTVMLANEISLSRFNELKKTYLNRAYLNKTDLHI